MPYSKRSTHMKYFVYNDVVKILIIIFTLLSMPAFASPVSHTGGPSVTKGQLTTEARLGYSTDGDRPSQDNRIFTRVHVDYGFTDYYALRIGWNQQKPDNDHFRHTDIRLENRFQFFKKKEDGWDFGARLSYVQNADNEPAKARFRLLAETDIAPDWSLRGNIFFMHDVGENAQRGLELDIRTQLMHRLDYQGELITSARVGAELFNDIGRLEESYSEQFHSVGGVAKFDHPNDLYTVWAYHRGISHAHPDDTFKFVLGRKF